MLKEIIKRERKHVLLLICDECETEYECKRYSYRHKKLHFCQRNCYLKSIKNGGVLRSQISSTNIEKYGGICALSSGTKQRDLINETKDHFVSIRTCLKRNGISNSSQLPGHHDKVKVTSLRKYGVNHYFKSKEVRKRVIETNLQRYGSHSFMGTPEFIAKSKLTNQMNLGVEWPMQCKNVQLKVDWAQRNFDKHSTMKLNGGYNKSIPEDRVYQILVEYFGKDDVERQSLINKKWAIDFHVKSIDTYVQYDSYWHGYDLKGNLRDLNEVAEFKTKQDVMIHKKIISDQKQNEWFHDNGMKLVRIICDEYKNVDLVIQKICT